MSDILHYQDTYVGSSNRFIDEFPFRFFELFGTVFGFVVSDVSSKLSILREHRASNCSPHYITVQSMVDFEVDSGITKVKAKLPSGSRTLLRLHRALEFIILFIRRIQEAENGAKLSELASDAYTTTLSKYHPWLIRKGVAIALYTLPTKDQLIERLSMEDPTQTSEALSNIVTSLQPAYDTVQKVYVDNSILNLP